MGQRQRGGGHSGLIRSRRSRVNLPRCRDEAILPGQLETQGWQRLAEGQEVQRRRWGQAMLEDPRLPLSKEPIDPHMSQ